MTNRLIQLGLCGLFFIVGAARCLAQTPAATPTPQATPNQQEVMRRQIEEQQRVNREFERMRAINDRVAVRSLSGAYNAEPSPYRRTNKKERLKLAPTAEDAARFAEFLRQPDTGLVKLAADKGCAESEYVVVATADCLAYTMPGAGSSYSFRVKDYRLQRLADITFTNESFQAAGIRQHGILTAIGDVSLEQTNLTTKGSNYLVNFQPESDFEKAVELDRQLTEGVNRDGFRYRRAAEVKENTTYLMRSVAYRGKFGRSRIDNEIVLDKRRDVIVAFRVVRRHDDGAVTILWKLLAKQDSPKTTWRKNDKNGNADFRLRKNTPLKAN